MKKYLKLIVPILIITLFFIATFVYATTDNLENEATNLVNDAISFKTTSILSKLNKNANITEIENTYDKILDKNLYTVSTDNYLLKLDSSSKNLVGIYEKESSYNLNTTDSKEFAEKVIRKIYSDLELPSEYDLVYLEKFDDYAWEADFQKKYDGVYNMYEAVKVFFNPENQEVIALTVFDEPYTNSTTSTISSDKAISNAVSSINLEKENIKDANLTLIKENNYYDENNTGNDIHKAWVLSTDDDRYIYVDASSGEIIGGDCVNE